MESTVVERRQAAHDAIDSLQSAVDDLDSESANIEDPNRLVDVKVALVIGRAALVNAHIRRQTGRV